MKIRKDDTVRIIKGKDAGKDGKVIRAIADKNMVVVENINVVKRHVKKGVVNNEGGIINFEKPISASNVMLVCPKCNKPVRVGYSVAGAKKFRVCKQCGEALSK